MSEIQRYSWTGNPMEDGLAMYYTDHQAAVADLGRDKEVLIAEMLRLRVDHQAVVDRIESEHIERDLWLAADCDRYRALVAEKDEHMQQATAALRMIAAGVSEPVVIQEFAIAMLKHLGIEVHDE